MKIIFISIAAFVLLLSCSEEKVANPTQPNAAKNKWDTVFVDIGIQPDCKTIWLQGPIIIKNDSTYYYHANYTKQRNSPNCDSLPFPIVNFTTHDVIWWTYEYNVYQENPITIFRKNDSLKKYEFISILSAKHRNLGIYTARHFNIVPKLLPDYSISFIRDTINKEQ